MKNSFGQTINFSFNVDSSYAGKQMVYTNTSTGFPSNIQFIWNNGECMLDSTILISNCNDTLIGNAAYSHVFWIPGFYISTLTANYNGILYKFTDTVFINPPKQILAISCDCNNIILNPGFENFNFCPDLNYPNGMHPAFAGGALSNWYQPPMIPPMTVPDPNYFLTNSCSPGGAINPPAWMPCNPFGFEQGYNSSNAYIGLVTYNSTSNYREYAEEQIQCALLAGDYEISMQVSLPENFKYANNNLAAYLSIGSLPPSNTIGNLPYTPQFLNATTISTRNAWTTISGIFTAIGNEDHITIGNFNNNVTTNNIFVNNIPTTGCTYQGYQNSPFSAGYYYIDEVKLKPHIPKQITVTNSPCGLSATLTSAGGNGYTYLWNTGAISQSIIVTSNGIYTVTVTHATGCTATATVQVTVNPGIGVNLITTPSCINSGTANASVSGGTPPYSYLWSNGQTTNPAIGLTSGVYTVTVTSNGGCTATATVSVVNSPPIAAPIIQGSHAKCVAGIYSVSNSYVGTPVTIAWSYQLLPSTTLIPQGTGTIVNFSPVLFNSAPNNVNIYCVVTNTTTGCTSSSSITLYPCCSGTFNFSNQTSSAISSNIFSTGIGQTVFINGTFTVNSNFTFYHANVVLGPDARIIVQGNNQLHIIDGSHLYSCNGDYMWDGIFVGSANAVNQGFVEVLGSTIEDGLNAIVSTNGGRLKLTGSTFNKNFKHVVINNYAGLSSFCDIKSTTFKCNSSGGTPAVLIKPYLNFKSYVGVEINNASLVRIEEAPVTGGGPPIVPTTNLFENLDYGIKATNSSFEVYLSRFKNINSNNSSAPIRTCGTAIYAEGMPKPNTAYYNTIIGAQVTPVITINNTETYPNEFINCNNGINLNNNMAGTIAYNTFYDIAGAGINLSNATGIDYNVHDNALSYFNIGIQGTNLYSMALLNFSKNELANSNNYGIKFNNASLNQNNLLLFNNSISNCRIGTYATNIDGLLIDGNVTEKSLIAFNSSLTLNNDYYGIWLQYCPNARVNYVDVNNKISFGPPPNIKKTQGVTIENSSGAIISQCKMENLGSAIRLKNTCLANELHCNKMDNCLRGVNLDFANFGANPTQGVIGTGNAGIPWDNQWLNMTPTYIRVNGTITAFNKINWLFKGIASTQAYNPGNGNVLNPFSNQTGNNACLPLLPAHENEYQDEVIDDVVDATAGGGQTYEEQYYDDEYAYRKLNEDSTLLNPADSAYQLRLQFYTAQSQTAIGKFYRIKSYIDAGAIDTAIASLATINASNAVEQNIYNTFYIYLTTYATGVLPDSMQLATLENIATQHVMSGGPGVYNARAMINWEQDDAGGALRLQSTSEIVSEVNINEHPKFYPNPASTTIYLPYSINQFETVSVEVYNFMGSRLNSQNFSQDQIIAIDLTTESNGFYFAKVYLNNKIWFCNMIIVAKK